jgi:hypothetical protein
MMTWAGRSAGQVTRPTVITEAKEATERDNHGDAEVTEGTTR